QVPLRSPVRLLRWGYSPPPPGNLPCPHRLHPRPAPCSQHEHAAAGLLEARALPPPHPLANQPPGAGHSSRGRDRGTESLCGLPLLPGGGGGRGQGAVVPIDPEEPRGVTVIAHLLPLL